MLKLTSLMYLMFSRVSWNVSVPFYVSQHHIFYVTGRCFLLSLNLASQKSLLIRMCIKLPLASCWLMSSLLSLVPIHEERARHWALRRMSPRHHSNSLLYHAMGSRLLSVGNRELKKLEEKNDIIPLVI